MLRIREILTSKRNITTCGITKSHILILCHLVYSHSDVSLLHPEKKVKMSSLVNVLKVHTELMVNTEA